MLDESSNDDDEDYVPKLTPNSDTRKSRLLRGEDADEPPDLVDDDSISLRFLYHISLKRDISLFGNAAEEAVAKEIQKSMMPPKAYSD